MMGRRSRDEQTIGPPNLPYGTSRQRRSSLWGSARRLRIWNVRLLTPSEEKVYSSQSPIGS
jgi:hypothetical protein